MKSRTRIAPAALAATVALVLAACGDPGPQDQGGAADGEPTVGGEAVARGGSLVLGIIQEPPSWDPAQAHVGHRLQPYQPVYDSLLLREPDGTLAPMLATEWGYTDDENRVLSLDVRTDVTFSDGAPFDAEAVVANIEHFQAENGPQAGQAAAIESAVAVDEDTVEITLSQPDPALEYYLSQALGLMGHPELLGTDGMDRLPVGTGPYVMDEAQSVAGSQYVFTAREDYWNPELQSFDQITLKLLADVTSRVNGLISGEIDATLVDGATMAQAEGAGFEGLDYTTDWQGLLLFDREGTVNPALSDVRVRQAINYAFDREALLEQLSAGVGEVTSQVFGPETTAYLPELEDAYSYDPEKALELMAEAGYEDGFTLELPMATPGTETIMTFVAQQLADIGITVELTSVPIADFQGELGSGKYAASWFSLFQGPTWVAYSQLLSDTTLYNPFDTTTPEIEEALEALRTGGDSAEEAAQDLNRYVTENAWFAPWFRPGQLYFYDSAKVSVEPQVQQAVPSIYNYRPAS